MKRRHQVLALLATLSVLTFLDRLAIAVAGPGIQADLHISPQDWGWVLSAYVLANGLFEMPSGAMGDRRGQRGELTRIVAWWSTFTALTGWCRGFWQLLTARFLFGAGAAGAYPNSAGAIARWFPVTERSRSQGVVWAASRLGGALAPLLIIPLQAFFGWRSVFWLLGAGDSPGLQFGTHDFVTAPATIPKSPRRSWRKLGKARPRMQADRSPGGSCCAPGRSGSSRLHTGATAQAAGSTSPGFRYGWCTARTSRWMAFCWHRCRS